MKNIICGPNALVLRICSAPSGVDVHCLHEMFVETDEFTEEEFFLAFHAAQIRLKYMDELSPSTGR